MFSDKLDDKKDVPHCISSLKHPDDTLIGIARKNFESKEKSFEIEHFPVSDESDSGVYFEDVVEVVSVLLLIFLALFAPIII